MTEVSRTQGIISQDEAHMARALALAARGLFTTDPNPRVGCVLVRDGNTLGEGWHERAGEAHAEVRALRAAAVPVAGATAYVTLEPCSHTGRTPPCADALIAAGIGRVVCATADPNPLVAGGGIKRLEAAGISVTVGVLAAEARALNIGFFSRFERARPWIRLKLAMSLDGRTAAPAVGAAAGTGTGGSSPGAAAAGTGTTVMPSHEAEGAADGRTWITGEASRADVQTWRARSSAIMTGAGTVRVDDPRLNVRLDYGPWVRQPLRVVLDPDLSCPPEAKVFHGGAALVFAALDGPYTGTGAGTASATGTGTETATGIETETETRAGTGTRGGTGAGSLHSSVAVPVVRVGRAPDGGLDLGAVMERLTAREVNELLVECGPRLAGALIAAHLVDELILYVAPTLLGADAAPLTALRAVGISGAPPAFEFRDVERIGADVRLMLTPRKD